MEQVVTSEKVNFLDKGFENIPCRSLTNANFNDCYNYFWQGRYVSCKFVNPCDIEDFLAGEKKKETSRYAARNRRSKESEIFKQLQETIPLPTNLLNQLGKTSIVRLINSYLKTRNIIPNHLGINNTTDIQNIFGFDKQLLLGLLDGFMLLLSADGSVIYTSENSHDILGINVIDIMGESIYEFAHPCDHNDLKEMLTHNNIKTKDDNGFFIRLKCAITNTGKVLNVKSANFKVFHFWGHMIKNKSTNEHNYLCICQSIPHPSKIEHVADPNIVLTKHTLDMKFSYVDNKFENFGYSHKDLLNESIYNYVHTGDLASVASTFKSLYVKGQCETCRYRLLAKNGGYLWIVTQASVIYDKCQTAQNVMCIHYTLSGVENHTEVYTDEQLNSLAEKSSKSVNENDEQSINENEKNSKENIKVEEDEENFETATWKIFGPRTPEMNQGFLTFSDDSPGVTMLTEDPDDLTHLAPTAGDVCVPLENVSFITPDLFNQFVMKDNYTPLLNDLINSSKNFQNRTMDPFNSISYQALIDEINTSNILTPPLSKASMNNSPNNSLIDEDSLGNFITMPIDDSDDFQKNGHFGDFDTEKLSMLMSNDLMWGALDDSLNDKQQSMAGSDLEKLLTTNLSQNLVNPSTVLGNSNQNAIKADNKVAEKAERLVNKRNHNYLPVELNGNNNKRSKVTIHNVTNSGSGYQNGKSAQLLHPSLATGHAAKKKDTNCTFDTGGSKTSSSSSSLSSSQFVTMASTSNRTVIHNPTLNIKYNHTANRSANNESDSVLMNLLVSGCDLKAGYYCLPPKKAQKCSSFIS